MMDARYTAPGELARYQTYALIAGAIGVVAGIVGALIDGSHQFFRSYLLGYVFWIGVPLGCFAILMIHHLAGGSWGLVIRRILEAATRTMPLFVILFLPIALGVRSLYQWAVPEQVAADAALQHKSAYLNVPFFLVRAAIYFAFWLGWMYLLNRWSKQQDETGDPDKKRKLQDISGPGLLFLGGTVTFAAIDWVMSLEPHWFSTIFGLLLLVGQGLSAMAVVSIAVALLRQYKPMADVITPGHLNDYGKLMLTFVMLWAYMAFSQFLIMWSGNLPEEIPWYLTRLQGGWQGVALLLILFHFALPFLLLLPRATNRNPRILMMIALLLIVMRVIDLFWMIAPSAHHGSQEAAEGAAHATGFHLSLLDIGAPLAIGGIWAWFFINQLRKQPLLPINDPNLEAAIRHGRE